MLKRLSIRGFKSIRELEDFELRNLNVLIGANGAGKSNFIALFQMAGCRPQRFVPHIQPYEFESLLFSDVARFAEVEPDWQRYIETLRSVRRSAASPEHINDGRNTHPAARLTTLLHSRKYRKVLHGAAVSARIGIECIRAECLHFGEWLDHVEGLPPLARAE